MSPDAAQFKTAFEEAQKSNVELSGTATQPADDKAEEKEEKAEEAEEKKEDAEEKAEKAEEPEAAADTERKEEQTEEKKDWVLYLISMVFVAALLFSFLPHNSTCWIDICVNDNRVWTLTYYVP